MASPAASAAAAADTIVAWAVPDTRDGKRFAEEASATTAAASPSPSSASALATAGEDTAASTGPAAEGEEESGEPPAKRPRGEDGVVARRKYALLMGFNGAAYHGMQRNTGFLTVEEVLLRALTKGKFITKSAYSTPQNTHFQRCARTDRGVSAARQVRALGGEISSRRRTAGRAGGEQKTHRGQGRSVFEHKRKA